VSMEAATTVVVAMSGGVDSSVAAALLVEQGYRVIGVTIKTFCYTHAASAGRTCCGLDGIIDARRVAGDLGIPHYVFDMEESFTRTVIDDFVDEYAAGRTPNPCVRCNSNTKIPHLLERAGRLGASLLATGHYAQAVVGGNGRVGIRRAVDGNKDQTYFLWGVPRDAVQALRFPLGRLTKPEVRARAHALGLVTAAKPESQEICFVPEGRYTDFLARRLGADHPALADGELVTESGRVLGRHAGYAGFTVGQRRGLGLGGGREPLYVLGVRPAARQVVVGPARDLERDAFDLVDLNWIEPVPTRGERVSVQIRHRAPAVTAVVAASNKRRITLRLDAPHRAVTPGQSGALYRGELLIGGGRIRVDPARLG
jgi:tRNA-specific 2-thiouridylase